MSKPPFPFPTRAITGIDDLMAVIAVLPEVPGRCDSRVRGVYAEAWILARYLAVAASEQWLDFPIRVVDREHPDVQLITLVGTFNIEITEAIPRQYSHALAMAEAKGYARLPGIQFFLDDAGLSHKEIETLVSGAGDSMSVFESVNEGFTGSMAEQVLTKLLMKSIERKCELSRKPHFMAGDNLQLIVYDNTRLQIRPYVMMELLRRQIPSGRDELVREVWVLSGACLARVPWGETHTCAPAFFDVPRALIE